MQKRDVRRAIALIAPGIIGLLVCCFQVGLGMIGCAQGKKESVEVCDWEEYLDEHKNG